MAIYTIQQLRDTAPAEFRDLPEDELVRNYSRSVGMPFEQAADFFGVKPRGTLAEMGRQALGGAVVDLPKMVGQGLQFTGIAPEFGREMAQAAEARAPEYEPDMRGRGLGGQALVYGARGLAPVAATLPLALVPGGQFAAPAAAAALFGTSSAQETYEKLLGEGRSEEEAAAAARRVGLVQGPLEGAATAVGLRAFRPALAAVRGAPTAAGVAAAATDTGVLRPLAKGLAINMAVQPGTEVAQDVGTELIERAYGARPEDIGDIAKQSALGGAGLTLLLGPLAAGGSIARSRRAESLKQALYGEATPAPVRAQAIELVTAEARRQGVADADIASWTAEQFAAEDARAEALRTAETERRNAQINLLGEEAQGLEGLQQPTAFSSLEQQRAFEEGMAGVQPATPFASLEQQRAFEQGLQQMRDDRVAQVGGQYQDLLATKASSLMAAQDAGAQAQQIMAPQGRGLEAAQAAGEQWQEIRAGKTRLQMDIDDIGQAWQKRAAEIAQPVTGELTSGQKAALRGPEGKRLKKTSSPITPTGGGPMATTLLQPPQTTVSPLPAAGEAAPSSLLTDRPEVSPPGAPTAVAASSPAAPVAAGSFPTNVPTEDGTQTTETVETETQGQAAPAAAGPAVKPAKLTGTPKPTPGAKLAPGRRTPVVEDEAADEQLTAATQKTIDELGLRPLLGGASDNLKASVTGGRIGVGGKASLPAKSLASAVKSFLGTSSRKAESDAGKLAAAARDFGAKYMKYLNVAGNAVPTERKDKQGNVYPMKPIRGSKARGDEAVAAERADVSVTRLKASWTEVQQALTALGEAAGNNAKNVETMIRVAKDEIGRRKADLQAEFEAMDPDTAADLQDIIDEIARLEQLDQGLSSGWAAAKRGIFRTDTDMLDVRGGEVRTSTEEQQQGIEQPLERAAKFGAAVGPRSKPETGFQGVLNYIRGKGTPFERLIAKAVSDVFKNTKNPPTLVFAEGTPQYNPRNNTITMSSTASPEVALHEALHAALQWYVHSNPSNPLVKQLIAAVDKVVAFDTKKLSPKAAEVQQVLATLKKGKKDLDAVLELISYGNTMVEFRKALEGMPTQGTPTAFVKAAKDVWNMILATVQRMLGVPRSVASDVIMDSFKLLEEASRTEYKKPRTGGVLKAAVQSIGTPTDAKVADAIGVTTQDFTRWKGGNLLNLLPTQRLFESVGLSEANMRKFVGANATKFADKVRKDFPGVERVLGLIDSRFSVASSVSEVMDKFKLNKGIGYQYAEDLANVISRRPAAEVNALFAYLDGDKKALDKLPDAAKLKANADKLDQWFKLYVSELSDVEQRFFNSRKFTETLLFPQRTEQVAGGTFGLGKINEVLGLKRKSETELDKDWFTADANGDLITDGDMYQVFKVNNTVKPGVPEPSGFMSAARYAELQAKSPLGYSVDTTRKWLFEGASDQGKYAFITNSNAQEKVADRKADDVANALRNTIAALANNYASKNFIKSVHGMGRGDSAHAQVAFDNLAAVNKEYGTNVRDDQVLKVSYEMSRSPQTKNLYRQSGTWVQLPESAVYGELSGKILPGPVWNAMIDMSDRQPLVNARAINNTMRWFKKSKTIWNPGTHVTNAASNVTMAMLHDISFSTMTDAAKLLAKYEAAPGSLTKPELDLVLAFRDSGAMLADYSSAEVKEALYKAHADNLRGGEDVSVARRVAGWLKLEQSKAEWLQKQQDRLGKVQKLDDYATQMYAAEDNIFRLAAFLKTAGELQSKAGTRVPSAEMLQEAGKFARVAFGDYDIDSKAVKVARQTVLPFVSWFYAMAPVIGRIAVYQPWKLANVLASYMLLEAALGAAGGDDEEARKNGPESLRERMFFGSVGPYMHVRIPFMGDDQNPVYYKLGDYFPMASMTKGLPNGFMGQSWFPGGLTPGGPFVSGIAGMVLGVDPYTGKSIHKPTDTDWDKLWNVTKFGYDIVTPPAVSSRNIGRVNDLLEGKTGITGVEPSPLVLARMFGLKVYDYNATEQAAINDLAVQRIERDFKSAMTKAKRDEYSRGYPDYEALDAELDDLRERMEKAIEKARGGAEE